MKQKITYRLLLLLAAVLVAPMSSWAYSFTGDGRSASDPFVIANRDQLQELAAAQNAGEFSTYLYQFGEIYVKLSDSYDDAVGTFSTPIGYYNLYPFRGHFDGNGKTVENLSITKDGDYLGIFGYVNGLNGDAASPTIKNLNLTINNVESTGSNVGALVGWVDNGYITDITVEGVGTPSTGHVYTTGSLKINVGGVIGYMASGNLVNVEVKNLIVNGGNNYNVGAIVGNAGAGLTFENCTYDIHTKLTCAQYTDVNYWGTKKADVDALLVNEPNAKPGIAIGNQSGLYPYDIKDGTSNIATYKTTALTAVVSGGPYYYDFGYTVAPDWTSGVEIEDDYVLIPYEEYVALSDPADINSGDVTWIINWTPAEPKEPGTINGIVTLRNLEDIAITFNILKLDIATAVQALDPTDFTFNGEAQKPTTRTLTFTDSHGDAHELVLGTDYNESYWDVIASIAIAETDIINVGEYQVVYTADPSSPYFEGTANSASFFIKKLAFQQTEPDKAGYVVFSPVPDYVYTGSAIKPTEYAPVTIVLKDGGTPVNLVAATDYDVPVAYTNNINVGTATIKITAATASNFEGTASTTFNITPKQLNRSTIYDWTMSGNEVDVKYDGNDHAYTVTSIEDLDRSEILVAGTDYAVVGWKDVVNDEDVTQLINVAYDKAADPLTYAETYYYLYIEGQGNYTGTVTWQKRILRKDLTDDADSNGDEDVTINTTPYVYDRTTRIIDATHYSVNDDVISAALVETTDDGVTGDFKVTSRGGGNMASTYSMTIEGIRNYKGTKSANWKVLPKDITDPDVALAFTNQDEDPNKYIFKNEAIVPEYTITWSHPNDDEDSYDLVEDTPDEFDFEGYTEDDHTTVVDAADVKNVNTYAVKITGKGNYTGTIFADFIIKKLTLQDTDPDKIGYVVWQDPFPTAEYDGLQHKLSPTATVRVKTSPETDITLVASTDFDYEWNGTDYVNATVDEDVVNSLSSVTISADLVATSNYEGAVTKNYVINKRELIAPVTTEYAWTPGATFADVEYDGTDKMPVSMPTDLIDDETVKANLSETNHYLVENTDFETSWTDNNDAPVTELINVVRDASDNVDSYKMTIEGKGNYKGTVAVYTLKITAKPIGDGTVEATGFAFTPSPIADQQYTGLEIVDRTTDGKSVWKKADETTDEDQINVTYNSNDMVEDTDYEISWADNKLPGTATITITGKGNYTDSFKKTFTIKKMKIYGIDVINIAAPEVGVLLDRDADMKKVVLFDKDGNVISDIAPTNAHADVKWMTWKNSLTEDRTGWNARANEIYTVTAFVELDAATKAAFEFVDPFDMPLIKINSRMVKGQLHNVENATLDYEFAKTPAAPTFVFNRETRRLTFTGEIGTEPLVETNLEFTLNGDEKVIIKKDDMKDNGDNTFSYELDPFNVNTNVVAKVVKTKPFDDGHDYQAALVADPKVSSYIPEVAIGEKVAEKFLITAAPAVGQMANTVVTKTVDDLGDLATLPDAVIPTAFESQAGENAGYNAVTGSKIYYIKTVEDTNADEFDPVNNNELGAVKDWHLGKNDLTGVAGNTLGNDDLINLNGWTLYDGTPIDLTIEDPCKYITYYFVAKYNDGANTGYSEVVKYRAERKTELVSSHEWITYYAEKDLKPSADMFVYTIETANAEDGVIELSASQEVIPANTAVLLRTVGEGNTYYLSNLQADASAWTATVAPEFKGVTMATDYDALDGDYKFVLVNNEFVKVSDDLSAGKQLAANRAYLAFTGAVPYARFALPLDENGEVTAIMNAKTASNENGEWYNLQGMKLDKAPAASGLYIFNGRKVVIK